MSEDLDDRLIAVGVDGTESSRRALDWALHEATLRNARVRLIHTTEGDTSAARLRDYARAGADEMLAGEAAHAAAVAPEIEVSTSLQENSPVAALLDEGSDAELVVIGNRQQGEFASVSLGSVGLALASHAPCPVVVVRQAEPDVTDGPSAGRIVVGMDDSPASQAALRFALDEARLRHTGLTAVSAWSAGGLVSPHLISHLGFDLKVIEREQETLLGNQLSDLAGQYPDVEIVRKAPMGHPAHELIRESAGAALVVVGYRGRGGFRGLLLGSTTHALLHHSPAPVGVIREK